jgi:folate-dependent phosphoribosylglycinamide formyltransferase PurN
MAFRGGLGRLKSAGWWKPSAAAYLIRSARSPAGGDVPTDEASLRAAAAWLTRAQDAAGDGGICGRYSLARGWSSSYPETTGYTIPTWLTLADVLADGKYCERANRSAEFLLSVQLRSGAFPGLEIADNRTEPSAFNSAQIVHGLQCWHRKTNDRRVLDAMMRAAHWLCDVQDDDGAWRQHFYRHVASTYSAHAACWLAELAGYVGEPRFHASAERNLRWVLGSRDPRTGWFDRCGFSADDHQARRAHTHTIAYTLDGVFRMSQCLQVPEARAAVLIAAERLLERLERSQVLAGVLNHEWRPQSSYVCLTGNAQLASLWLRLAEMMGDSRFANAAFKAIDDVKRAQSLESRSPGIRGGVAGSAPIGGGYIPFAFPNWAAKFFIDALCAKRAYLNTLAVVPHRPPDAPAADVVIRDMRVEAPPAARTVVVYTTRVSPKFARLAGTWRARGFAPALVVIETGDASVGRRLARRLRRRADESIRICRRLGWRAVTAPAINTPEAVAAIARTDPLVAVSAGAGILRQDALALPRLGTLNAHMGMLPGYRGMNVAEWAAFNGDRVGSTVFWLDRGIDTGPIIVTRQVDTAGCRSIDELRARVDESQLVLLDEVLRSIVEDGVVPLPRPQRQDEGRQFFRMHADLRLVLERKLSREQIRESAGP